MMKIGPSPARGLLQLVGLACFAGAGFSPISAVLAQAPARTSPEVYPESSHQADTLLRSAALHARDQQWAEAVEIYQRVIQQFGDKLTQLPKDDPASDPSGVSLLFVDVRQCCQARLAALPAEARAIYRSRVDSQAERWYRQGAADRDRSLLRRVVEEAFCSSWGDEALDLLGDLAFQEGRYAEALASYRQLVPDRPGEKLGLVHPDPSVNLPLVAAKKLLCRAALGEDPPRRADLDAFAATCPKAQGSLAGRTGPLLTILKAALSDDHLAAPAQHDGRWPTFAGSPTRTKVAPGPIDVGSFQWKVPLEHQSSSMMGRSGRGVFPPQQFRRASSGNPDKELAYYPIVVGDQVVVSTDKEITAYNLNDRPTSHSSGAVDVAWKHEHQPFTAPAATRASSGLPRFTLTAYGDRIYARLGPPGPVAARGMGGISSVIVAVDRSTDGKLLWKRPATEIPLRKAENITAGFEGSPVADAHSVYVALTESGVQVGSYVACLDADTGNPRWVRFLFLAGGNGDVGMGFGAPTEMSHRLLTLDGSTVYYQTNLGAVAALDAETGRIRWLATYPRPERDNGGSARERDLNPAIIYDGLVLVAPQDTGDLFAFDAQTGRLVWKSEQNLSDVIHVLGVAKGRLIATGNFVWSLDAHTGKVLSRWPDKPGFEGYGRGVLAGHFIYWPTKSEIHVLEQETGLPTDRPPIKLQALFQTTGGNLAVGDGYLVIAQPDALVVFCQNSRLIERYREEIAHAPDDASGYFRLAQAAESTDQDDLALENLTAAITKARASELVDGQPLLETARDHQYRLLIKLASRASAKKHWSETTSRLEQAAQAARLDRDRLSARLKLADTQAEAGDPHAAIVTLQDLLGEERLRSLSVSADRHRTVRADLLIYDRLSALLREHGRGLYAEFDKAARRLLDRGIDEKNPALIEEVGRSYPVSTTVPDALLALGEVYESQKRPGDAAHAYRRLLALDSNDAKRSRALLGLARAYESQQLWIPARDTYLRALARFADQPVEGADGPVALGKLVSERLAHPPFDRLPGARGDSSLPLPLVRQWGQRWEDSQRPLVAEGSPASPHAGHIFLAGRTNLRAIDPSTGKPSWTADLGGEPIWVGYLADRVIAATSSRLFGLDPQAGKIGWRSDAVGPRPGRAGLNPFAKAEGAEVRPGSAPGRLHDFRLVGSHVFCQRGDRELLAVDGDTGLIEWSYAPAQGQLNPHVWIGSEQIVLQARKPNAIRVLETATGRCQADYPQGDDEDWEREPFPIDDDHVALVVDRRTVALFDLKKGVETWTFRESAEQPRNGAPRLLGDAERLLVIYDGNQLIRLNPRTGGRLWARVLGSEDLSDRPEAMAMDAERFYWAGPGQNLGGVKIRAQLEAISLADGKVVWTRYLAGPETAWAITLADRFLAAFPNPAHSEDGPIDVLPLVFCRRDSGALVQRLLFQTPVSELAVRLAPQSALIATQSGLWALSDHAPIDGAVTP